MRGRPLEGARIVSPAIASDIAAITRVRAYFLLDPDEVAAAWTVLRREYADAAAVSDLIDVSKTLTSSKRTVTGW
jgi:hypothetical protein